MRLRDRIIRENKKSSVLEVAEVDGHALGFWDCDIKRNEFSYVVKSANRSELFSIKGNFLAGKHGRWEARIREISRSVVVNFFGEREYEKITMTMSYDEISKILGIPAGAYFAGQASFEFPEGRRSNWPFTGDAREFRDEHPLFFAKIGEPGYRAWISNDLAIWVYFSADGKVESKRTSKLRTPCEPFRFSN